MTKKEFLVYSGAKALSKFREKNIIKTLNNKLKGEIVTNLSSCHTYYTCLKRSLTKKEINDLKNILGIEYVKEKNDQYLNSLVSYSESLGEIKHKVKNDKNLHFISILPKPDSISPWSSNATDITHICGFDEGIERIEIGLNLLVETVLGFDFEKFLKENEGILGMVYDSVTQKMYINQMILLSDVLFLNKTPRDLIIIDLNSDKQILHKINRDLSLSLDDFELDFLFDHFNNVLKRNPSDAELFMFAQINSEHCRHKVFNSKWIIDDKKKDFTLFEMIKKSHYLNPSNSLSVYLDNASVYYGNKGAFFHFDPETKLWKFVNEDVNTLIKVETHNHPTALCPFHGAATGSGGEIRDESAVGKGSKTRAGLSGYTVSDLLIPDFIQPWETDLGKVQNIHSSFEIMIDAPIGSAFYNNEFGRPVISGYFRTLLTKVKKADNDYEYRGFFKPILLAGGLGSVRPCNTFKNKNAQVGSKLIVLGGESMLIGLGGGSSSSKFSDDNNNHNDSNSVQRCNAEVQRRIQQVIDTCVSYAEKNPIESIHDVGSGGLSNAIPEIINDCNVGAKVDLRSILSLEPSMSPMEIWCNESQERYVLIIQAKSLDLFTQICTRERSPFCVVGEIISEPKLIVYDEYFGNYPVNVDLKFLFPNLKKQRKNDIKTNLIYDSFDISKLSLTESVERVLKFPAVGSKSFLITIGDRFITGLVDRDQMIGPWQVPVSNVGVVSTSFLESMSTSSPQTGDAIALGEKPALAIVSPVESAKMAIAESLMNLVSAHCTSINNIKISANWMTCASHPGEAVNLFNAVEEVALKFCPELGISIPVGKDSLSMSMKWDQNHVVSPLTLISTAYCSIKNVMNTWTPQFFNCNEETILVLVDLASDVKKSLGGSALAQVYKQIGDTVPKVHSTKIFKLFIEGLILLHEEDIVLAYHDVSDGGVLTTVLEMSFASRSGVTLTINDDDLITEVFNEELGAVFQIKKKDYERFVKFYENKVPLNFFKIIGKPNFDSQVFELIHKGKLVYKNSRAKLQQIWSLTSYNMQKLRDNPTTSEEEFNLILDDNNPGLFCDLKFDLQKEIERIHFVMRPKVAILREQGVNSQSEMAWSFQQAGFDTFDLHMSDIISGKSKLDDYIGLAVCGGFSYGDVFGAGVGWAHSTLLNNNATLEFSKFFKRENTFSFGACNGCQFLTRISLLIPGTEDWPIFKRNVSEQYEARWVMVKVDDSPDNNSIFLKHMKGSSLPIVVAHGEGNVFIKNPDFKKKFNKTTLNYIDNYGKITEQYPFNPNGSVNGIAGIRSLDGRVLVMMPHPERVTRLTSNSWNHNKLVDSNSKFGPWFLLFKSAREWVGNNF